MLRIVFCSKEILLVLAALAQIMAVIFGFSQYMFYVEGRWVKLRQTLIILRKDLALLKDFCCLGESWLPPEPGPIFNNIIRMSDRLKQSMIAFNEIALPSGNPLLIRIKETLPMLHNNVDYWLSQLICKDIPSPAREKVSHGVPPNIGGFFIEAEEAIDAAIYSIEALMKLSRWQRWRKINFAAP